MKVKRNAHTDEKKHACRRKKKHIHKSTRTQNTQQGDEKQSIQTNESSMHTKKRHTYRQKKCAQKKMQTKNHIPTDETKTRMQTGKNEQADEKRIGT